MIRRKMILICVALIVFVSVVGIITVSSSLKHTIDHVVYDSYVVTFETTFQEIDDYFVNARSQMLSLCSTSEVQTLLNLSLASSLSQDDLQEQILSLDDQISKSGFSTFSLFPLENGSLYQWDFYTCSLSALDATGLPDWYDCFSSEPDLSLFYSDQPGQLYIIKGVYDTKTWDTIRGYLCLKLDPFILASLVRVDNGSLMILDSNYELCYPYVDSRNLSQELSDSIPASISLQGMDYLLLHQDFSTSSWMLVGMLSVNALTAQSRSVSQIFLITAAIAIAAALILAISLSNSITKPLTNLAQQMRHYEENGEPIAPPSKKLKGEVAVLYNSYQQMTSHVHNLIEEVYIAKIEEQEAEMRALQAQINPHFIYNTLDCINWMAAKYQATEIQKMIFLLSSMLRHSLNNGDNEITIRGELEQLKSYIGIHLIRTPDLFTVEYQVDPELLDCKIIKLLLQPLVENSIEHGFDGLDYLGKIIISIQKDGDCILIQVINNGKALDLQKIERLLDLKSKEKVKSYGIRNVNTRLVTRYGEAYRLSYQYCDGLTTAVIRIPLEETRSKSQ